MRAGDFVQKYFWMAAIDVCGTLRRFRLVGDSSVVQLYLFPLSFISTSESPFLGSFHFPLSLSLSRSLSSFLSMLAHMINVCQEYDSPLCSTTSRGVHARIRATPPRDRINVICNILIITTGREDREKRGGIILTGVVISPGMGSRIKLRRTERATERQGYVNPPVQEAT